MAPREKQETLGPLQRPADSRNHGGDPGPCLEIEEESKKRAQLLKVAYCKKYGKVIFGATIWES